MQQNKLCLTDANVSSLKSLFGTEDEYMRRMNDLVVVRTGLEVLLEALPNDHKNYEQVQSAFDTMNHMIGAIASDKRPPFYRFVKDRNGKYLKEIGYAIIHTFLPEHHTSLDVTYQGE